MKERKKESKKEKNTKLLLMNKKNFIMKIKQPVYCNNAEEVISQTSFFFLSLCSRITKY
jgi:hypothetical protein